LTTNVIMPVLGMVQDTGTIVRWLKSPGETVRQGEALMEVETDKAVQELEAPASGILGQILAKEGDVVPVTQVVAVILTPEEYRSTYSASRMGLVQPAGPESRSAEHGALNTLAASSLADRTANTTPEPHYGRILASPKARRLAQEAHQDLAALRGSGPGGAVLARDVETSAAKAPALQIPALAETPQAWTAAPHFILHYRARVAHFLAWHALLQKTSTEITLPDLLVFIASRALLKHPKINAAWQDGKITHPDEINISLAVAVEGELVFPVIHHADRLNPGAIAKKHQELATRAQNGKLQMDDSSGGTFTISSLGMYRVDAYDAVLNAPQAAILAVGRITEEVIPVIGVQPVMNLSVSFDQRAIDDVSGAKFLETLADLIEEPLMLLT
jgi:pyruvate dehydrogenase E2 component (dihydrolipoamide acetyltransferase)